uniref:Chloride channel protein n=1 Tax=Kalmanozyma brasiliensis (strain GHG001) TaxID=1365824 RepID=V5EZW5_KALBG
MSVLLETSLGDIVIDLHTDLAPRSCTNFLKLCSKHFYKLNAFFRVEKDFLAQTGDPSNTGKGGASIWSQLPSNSQDRSTNTYFHPETIGDQLQHTKKGTVSFACFRKQVKRSDADGEDETAELVAGSQFFITLKDEIDYLDGKHAPFGIVVEGQEPGGTLDKINEAFTDDQKRPLKDIRIRHVVVLEDPFRDPDAFVPPSRSPSPTPSQIRALRLADDEDLIDDRDDTTKEESRRNADTNAAALTLEMVGDLPFAEIRPPENILFVCKLNPVTRSDDLELIFSRFGKILSCEVIKDKKTGDSLQYAFIEFDQKDDAERASVAGNAITMNASPHSKPSALAPPPSPGAGGPGPSRRNSTYTANAGAEDDEALDEIRRYESFSTVDWVVDNTRERNRIARERQAASAHFVLSSSSNAHLANGSTHANSDAAWGRSGFGRGGVPPRWWPKGPWGRRAWLVWGILKTALSAFADSGLIVLVGILIGINMGVISLATEWASDLKQGYCSSDWVPWSKWAVPAYIIYILFAGILSFLCAHLVKAFAPYAAGSGISEIKCILAGFVINGYLGFWTLAIKSLTLPLAIASGLSVGKEGPAVHVACCIGNVVASFFRSFNRSQAKMRELLTASSAAGVAVAFGSPIGGVLFSLEEMAYNFPASTMWRSFLCALAATVTLSFMNPFRTGKLVLFQVSYDRDWHYFEIIFYILIGIFGGLYGAFVIKYNLQVQSFRRSYLAKHGVSEAVVLAVLTAVIGYTNKFLRIDMTESLEILFRECEGGGDYDNLCKTWAQWRMVNSLLLATVLRTALVIVSYGCKVPAGIFVPSMAIGATFGRMFGILVKALHNAYPHWSLFSACQPDVPCITPGTYAFLGAAAALAGVTRITVSVVVIMFELTGALTYILPTMIVVGITKGIADWFSRGGIAEQMIKFSGYPFLDKDDHNFGVPVADVMHANPTVLYADGMKLGELEARMSEGSYKGFPVVQGKEDAMLLGYVGKVELRYAIGKARRARALGADTTCVFSVGPNATQGPGSVGGRGAPQQDLLNVSSIPTTAAADRAVREDMLNRFSSATTLGVSSTTTSGGAGARRSSLRRHEAESLMTTLDDDASDAEDDPDADPILGPAGGGIDGEGESDLLELAGWIDPTPLLVQPGMALETVMDMFKNLGPRVILVVEYGKLSGLVTVKDVLKRIALEERSEAVARSAAAGLPSGATSEPSASGELELLLKEAYEWVADRWATVAPHVERLGDRFGRRQRASGQQQAGEGRYGRVRQDAGEMYDESGPALSPTDDLPLRASLSRNGSQQRLKKTGREQEQFVLGEEDE